MTDETEPKETPAPPTTDITKMSAIELKAMIYDESLLQERHQQNIKNLTQELGKR